jgi:hypothetical protein
MDDIHQSELANDDNSPSTRSARRIVSLLGSVLSIGSVVDFGCGDGAWLGAWREAGAEIVAVGAGLSEPVDLGRRFDLAQSLGNAPVPATRAVPFIDNLVAHASHVLFSPAGALDYWRGLFRERGYVAFDYLRPLIAHDPSVRPSYRYDALLYVREDASRALPFAVRARRIADRAAIADYRPFGDRLRNAMARRLSAALVAPAQFASLRRPALSDR